MARSGGGGAGGTPPWNDIKDVLKNLQTSIDMQNQLAGSPQNPASVMAKALKDNKDSIDNLAAMIGAMTGQSPANGPVRPGPVSTVGRGGAWPGGVYPGGQGYGSRGMPGIPTSPSAQYGSTRQMAAQFIDQRYGMGRLSMSQPDPADPNRWRITNQQSGQIFEGTRDQVQQEVQRQSSGNPGTVSRVAGGLNSGGISGMLNEIPVVGQIKQGAEQAYKAANFIGNQQKANSAYQSIYDQGNMAGMGQRVDQEKFKLGNMVKNVGRVFGLSSGGLSSSDADKAYQGISAMGYQGSQRNQRLNFATKNYTSMGMSVDESMQVISTASQTLTTSLGDLHTQLKAVSDVAKETGQNADVLRQSFIGNFSNLSQGGFGISSGTLAQAQTMQTTGLGRQFAGINIGGMTSSSGQTAITAAYAGYGNEAQFQAQSQSNPTIAAQGMQNRVNSCVNALGPAAKDFIMKEIAAKGGVSKLDSTVAIQIGQDASAKGLIQEQALQAMFTTQQITQPGGFFPTLGWLIMQMAQGGSGIVAATATQMKANDQQTVTSAQAANNSIAKATGNTTSQTKNYGVDTLNGKQVYDPVIQKAYSGLGKSGMVQVQTASGTQLVSMEDAAKNYRDQIANGTAIIATGPQAGQSIGDVYGKEYSEQYKDTTGAKAAKGSIGGKYSSQIAGLNLTSSQLSEIGKLDKTFGDKTAYGMAQGLAAQNSSGAGGTITVTMTPELSKYLGLTTTGSSLVTSGAVNNAPPTIPAGGSSAGH